MNKEKIGEPGILLVDLGKVLLNSSEKDHKGKLNPRHIELMEKLGGNYHFFDYFRLNEKLLSKLTELKEKLPIYMITEGKIQEYPDLKEKLAIVFDYEKIYSTGELGLDKKTPDAYEYVIKDLGVQPHKILFIDDSRKNSDAAKEAGLQVILFESEDQTVDTLQEYFNNI